MLNILVHAYVPLSLVKFILSMSELPVKLGAAIILREEVIYLPHFKSANKAVGVTGDFCKLYM